MPWLKNTKGKPDAALTFAVIAFTVVTLNLLLSTYAGCVALSPETITAYLAITFSQYVARRYSDKEKKEEVFDQEPPRGVAL